ncbi:aminotransferase class IV [Desulfovulcanus sp.]
MVKIVDAKEYLEKILSLHRPGEENYLAFYEHRLGVICKEPRLLLIPLDDHLVHRGDGVFETLKFVRRKIYLLDAHLERMAKSCKAIFIDPPCSWEKIKELAVEVARASGEDNGILSLFIGRGPGGFTTDFRECLQASLYIVARRLPKKPPSFWEKGVTAFKAETPAKQGYMAKIKSVNYLPNVLMKMEAIEKGYDFPLCFDEQGFLAEGSTENVVIVNEKGTLVIPEMNNALLGTTLMRGLDLIKNEVDFVFRCIKEDEIYEAREVILLGTTIDAVSVVRYNDKPIHDVRPGPVSKRLRELLQKDLLENSESGVEF